MNWTRDELKDKIFELEMEQKEIQTYLTEATVWVPSYEHYNKLNQENICWIAYYKDLLKELEQGEWNE